MRAGDPSGGSIFGLPYSSNATFLVEVGPDGARTKAVYKPHRGERPLGPSLQRHQQFPFFRLGMAMWAHVTFRLQRDAQPLHVVG